MTEEEAKTKLCPNSMSFPGVEGVFEPGPFKCSGSACMAWRWLDNVFGEPAYETRKIDDHGNFEHSPLGFCGLAGKPS